MPKLNATTAKAVAKQESSGGRQPLPAGQYEAHLVKVESLEGKASGKPYWKWTFELDEKVEGCFDNQFVNTSLSENALWKLNEVFAAFGVATNTDTDELLGEHVLLVVAERIIESGQRAGEVSNEVTTVLPFDGEPF